MKRRGRSMLEFGMRHASLVAAVLFGLAVLTKASGSSAAAPESPVEAGKVFVGDEGLAVAIVPLKPRAKNEVLVQVTGSGSDLDGKVIPHKVNVMGERKTNFETTWHGRGWVTIAVRESWWDARAYSLYLPGKRGEPKVRYDEKRTAALKAEDVYAAFKKQEADGTLKAFTAFDRKAETAAQDKQLAELAAGVATACGAKLAVKVDWASITDEDVKTYSIASYCGEPLETMSRMCGQSNEAKKAISAKVKSFTCTLGKAMKLDLAGTTVQWTTARDASNVGEFAQKALEQKL